MILPLGPPGAGKSTLKRRLLDMPLPEVSFSTPVADVPLQVAMIRDSKEGVRSSCSFSQPVAVEK